MSLVNLFCDLKTKGVPEADFPQGILCISDGEFDKAELGQTNIQATLKALANAGFSKEYVDNFVLVLWNIPNTFYGPDRGVKFETFNPTPNVFYFGGYSTSVISFLSEKVKTADELFLAAMDQEILNMIQL